MIKIAINGFGRIGRPTFKILMEKGMNVVAINDLASPENLAYLLKYDTNYGPYNKDIALKAGNLIVGDQKIKLLAEKDPAKLPWSGLEVDVVLECTGIFRDRAGASGHLQAGAKKVIVSAPCKSADVPTYVLGVNADKYQGENLISMASCTTNCLAPIVKILHEEFSLERGLMTTAHAYTAGQSLQDGPHRDFRRGRTAGQNIIPTTTGAAVAVTKVIPELEGKLEGLALRVPISIVSLVDLVAILKKEATAKKINRLLQKRAAGQLQGILAVSDEPLVSSDLKQNPHSAIVDLSLTVVTGNLVKILAWYDNEWGYANRLAEMAEHITNK